MNETNTSGFCVNCGQALRPEAKFCVGCGTQRAVVPAPVVPAPVVPAPVASPPVSLPPTPPRGEPEPSSNRNRAVLAGIVVGLVIVGVGALVWRSTSTHTAASTPTTPITLATVPPTVAAQVTPATPPQTFPVPQEAAIEQARALNAMLLRSAQDRSAIVAAAANMKVCRDLTGSVQAFVGAQNSRRALLATLQGQSLTLLPNADALRSTLATAWQSSIDSDASYIAWGADLEATPCDPSTAQSDPNYVAATTIDPTSQSAKGSFAAYWNEIAAQYRLPLQTASSI